MSWTKPGPEPKCQCGECLNCRRRVYAREWMRRTYRERADVRAKKRAANARRVRVMGTDLEAL